MHSELRRALRGLSRTPGFFLLAVATLGLGVGIATLLFSITESVLWRPFSYSESERLMELNEFNRKVDPLGSLVSMPNFRDWRDTARSFEIMAAMGFGETHSLTGFGERVRSVRVSSGFLETLRVRPRIGRTFTKEEEASNESRSVIVSDTFWKRQFEGASDVVNRSLKLDGESYAIVGVLPAAFRLEFVQGANQPDVLLPLALGDPKAKRNQRSLMALARLGKGVSAEQAEEEMRTVADRLARQHSEDAGWTSTVKSLRTVSTGYERVRLLLFFAFAALVLLIACANVGGLQLVRIAGRQKEYAVRLALGAGHAVLLREALAESTWIAAAGGGVGALLAAWGVVAVRTLLPKSELARSTDIGMDARSLGFVLAIAITVTLLFAVIPALLARKMDLDRTLRAQSRGGSASRGTRRRIDLLIGAEIALSFVLLFAAGLFAGSLSRLERVPLGFDPHNVLTMRIVPGKQTNTDERRQLFVRVMEQAKSTRGTQEVALTGGRPLDFPAGVSVAREGGQMSSLARAITPNYFHVMGIALLRGRAFTTADSADAPRVAIVNENLARSLFGTENPVGHRLTLVDGKVAPGTLEIVGLASNTKEVGIDEIPFNDVYLPFAQNPMPSMYLVMKTRGSAEAIVAQLRQQLRGMNSDGTLQGVSTMEEQVSEALSGARVNLALVGVFAALAVLLAAVGIGGAIAFSTAQRRREFAMRMALGAAPRSIIGLTLRHGMRTTLLGATTGALAAVVLGRSLKSALYLVPHLHSGLIYGVAVDDPFLFGAAAGVVLAIAVLAAMTPAARASHVDPAEVLRQDA